MEPSTETIQLIPRAQIEPGDNPRTDFDAEKLAQLCASMKERGFDPAFPLIVRPLPKNVHVGKEVGANSYNVIAGGPLSENVPIVVLETLLSKKGAEERMERLRAGLFEIAAGERRWRAAGLAGIKDIPCVVRALTDREMLETALIENIQRDDLSEMEEAMGYRRLLDFQEEGKPVHTPDSVAERIGLTAQHVRRLVSLCRLAGTKTEKALRDGAITASHGILLARIPSAALRDELLKLTLKGYGGAPWSVKELESKIALDYMLELRGAKFDQDDAELLPVRFDNCERIMGGACGDCPHNSATGEGKGLRHMCLNPECYRIKRARAHAAWAREVNSKTAEHRPGPIALDYEENVALWNETGTVLRYDSPFVDLSLPPAAEDVRGAVAHPPAWKKLIKGREVPVVLAKDENGKVRELTRRDLALAAARENDQALPATERVVKASQNTPADRDAGVPTGSFESQVADLEAEEAARKAARAREISRQIGDAQFAAVVEGALKFGGTNEKCGLEIESLKPFWGLAVDVLIATATELGICYDLAIRRGMGDGEQLESDQWLLNRAGNMNAGEQFALICDLLLTLWGRATRETELPKWAKLFGVNLKTVAKQVEKEIAEEEKFAAENAAAKKSALVLIPGSGPLHGSDDFGWNEAGVATSSKRYMVELPKSAKVLQAEVETARDGKSWFYGLSVAGPAWGNGVPCSRTGTKYGSEVLAIKAGLLEIVLQLCSNGVDPKAVAKVQDCVDGLAVPVEKPTKAPRGKKQK